MRSAGDRPTGHFLMGERVDAVYHPCEDPMYRHNCYIEALPPEMDTEKISRLLRRLPAYSPEERTLPPLRRLQAVQRIASCVIPLPEYLELERKFSRMIRNGYLARNPLSAAWTKQMRSGFPKLDWSSGSPYPYTPLIRSAAAGFSIIGASGVGKSTLVESILSLMPQIIVHREYQGHPFDQQQLVWLKLECPYAGSPRGLCISFFRAMDQLLGTRHAIQYDNRRRSTNDLLPVMAMSAGWVGLGVLVIDEIQRLREAKEEDAQTLLDFFVQLTNTIGVPVVLVGTFKASRLFEREFALARRTTGQGNVTMHNLALDESWNYFLPRIWKYQWTSVETPLTPELSKTIHAESQGIVDIAVKLYMLAQWQVIGSADERITPAIIREVAREGLRAVQPILRALRNKDSKALSEIEDIRPKTDMMEERLAKALRQASLQGALTTLQDQAASVGEEAAIGELPEEEVSMLLVRAGFAPDIALRCARAACRRFPAAADLKLASSEAFRLAAEEAVAKQEVQADEPPPKAPKKKAKVISLSGDLREIVAKAPKGTPPYQALKEAGVIRPATEFLAVEDL